MMLRRFSAFSLCRKGLPLALATLVATHDAFAIDYSLVLAPPKQVNNSTCQSYALAMALAMQEPAGLPATYEWRMTNEAELRVLEGNMRSAVVKAMKDRLG